MRYRRYGYGRKNIAFRIICIFLIAAISFFLLDAKLRPAIIDLAAVEAKAVAEKTVNSAVEKALSDRAVKYSDIVTVNYSQNNIITGITTDIVKMNLFKSEISKTVDKAFEKNGFTSVTVPFGSATGFALLSGSGPYIDIKIGMSGVTTSDFENIFESAGVNQTQHSVMLRLETTVMLTLAGRRITCTVPTSFCVAQTVIVGSVPEVTVNK